MAGALRKLFADFFSTIVFLAVYAATGDILIATGVAIAGAVVQFIRSRIGQEKLDIMTWASLGLGGATLLTKDPRFVLLKPAIGHFAIGTIMLRKDWMLRYSPPMVRETVPHIATIAGYIWAAFIFALGLGVIAVAMIAVGAKIVAFGITWIILRVAIARKLRAAAATAT
ncbi:intracellular septation protein [Afipia massiliensis]|uniref:Intracellular septation protein n=1 Tax=Afipia massiliensis TaxID=211460 RepID=A0A4U6BQ06_9BRAD|nr:septation protein IspZ [Afipia massiliensis]TKT72502.1 intracellular septation protein [Afipia massiliensis]